MSNIYEQATEELNKEFANELGTDHTQFVYSKGKKWEFIKIIVERTLKLEAKLVWSYPERGSVEEVKKDVIDRLEEFRDEFSRIISDD